MALTAVSNGITARICEDLAERLGHQKYNLWFDRTAKIGLSNEETLCVTVPTRFHADWIERNFRADLREIAASNTGRTVEVRVSIVPSAFAASEQPAIPVSGIMEASGMPQPLQAGWETAASNHPPTGGMQLNTENGQREVPSDHRGALRLPAGGERLHRPAERGGGGVRGPGRYDLNHFVVGPSNELAYRAAVTLAQGSAPFRTLFIYGGCGLGKTHLLEGICGQARRATPDKRIRYVTGEQFTNEFLASLRHNDLDAFRRRIRKLDLLAIDDVHFLSNKTATQNEFLCTFDAIGMMGAQLVLASDEHPRLIRQFHERLISRFLSGMVVEVQMPDYATRLSLIEQMILERGRGINATAARLVAERFVGSVRELQGFITRLGAFADLCEQQNAAPAGTVGRRDEIGVVLVRQLLEEIDAAETPRSISINFIIEASAEYFGISASSLLGPCRHANAVMARSICAFLGRRLTTQSYPELARSMSRKNHSTIVTAVQRIEKSLDQGESFALHSDQPATDLRTIIEQVRMRAVQAAHQK